MSRKYIKQIINENFVFPNNEVSEYDLDELVHDINDNAVSGTITSLSATTVTSSQIVLTFNYSWSQNNAEVWVNPNGKQQLISVHMLADGQDYYKPWRMIGLVETATTGQTTYSGTTSVTGTTANMGVANFPSGVYYLEFRFIGHRAVIPACASINITAPTPTPTPTVTMTVTPTATPTPTPCIECYEYSYTASTSGLLEWLDCDGIMSDAFVASGGTYNITCPGARAGTVTGDGTIVQGALCSGCPTPTPTPTPGTPTPTMTMTPTITPTQTITPTFTPTPTPPSFFELTGCGRSNTNEGGACSDANSNNRTFYSTCDLANFGAGCFVYEDAGGTIPVAYTYIFIGNLGNYDTDGVNGYVTGASANQC